MSTSPTVHSLKRYLLSGVIVITILVVLIVAVLGAYLWLPANVHYHITERYLISANDDQWSVYLGVILPKSGPYQTVKNVNVVWDGEQELNSHAYVDTLKLWNYVNGGQALEAIVEYDVILPQGKASWQAPIEQHQLLPQDGIESDHPTITSMASQLSSSSPWEDAYRIYRFTLDHLSSAGSNCEETNLSALEAYRSRVSACMGYSRLMVALCRASGIPAKMVMGIILPDILLSLPQISSTEMPISRHAWVEYSSLGSWKMADPSWSEGYLPALEFNRNDGRHLSYGEFDQFIRVSQDLSQWASDHAFPLEEQLTYIFAASMDSASIVSRANITKSWDGRWLNTLLVFAGVTVLLIKIRDRIFRKEKATPKAESNLEGTTRVI